MSCVKKVLIKCQQQVSFVFIADKVTHVFNGPCTHVMCVENSESYTDERANHNGETSTTVMTNCRAYRERKQFLKNNPKYFIQ